MKLKLFYQLRLQNKWAAFERDIQMLRHKFIETSPFTCI